jgi:hypothetical protein
MHRNRYFVPLGVLVSTALAWLCARYLFGRTLNPLEVLLIALVALAVFAWWRARRLRIERQEEESMRDSALW